MPHPKVSKLQQPGTMGAVKTLMASLADPAVTPTLEVFHQIASLDSWVAAVSVAIQDDETSSLTNCGMSAEALRLFLQSYNAGPYATLRYRGSVPYRETRTYVKRVMRYYQDPIDAAGYESFVEEAARKYGLDPQLIRAIMKAESDMNPRCVSSKGASGLMQVMPVVWSEIKRRYGIPWDYRRERFDPAKNIDVACAYLAWLKYDFLPKHFAAVDEPASVPATVVRDPSLKTASPRLATKSVDPIVRSKKREIATPIVHFRRAKLESLRQPGSAPVCGVRVASSSVVADSAVDAIHTRRVLDAEIKGALSIRGLWRGRQVAQRDSSVGIIWDDVDS
jgi:hypothetical protein